MADIVDTSAAYEEELRNKGIAAIQEAWREQTKGKSASHCLDCDEEIPKGRQLAVPGVKYCVYCAEFN